MLSQRKIPRLPTSLEQQLDTFNWSVKRSDHFVSTLDRKVYVLDGFGNLTTVARTTLPDSKVKRNPMLTITTAFIHDKRSRTEQIEDNLHSGPSDELAKLYDVTGNAGVVLSQSVDFSFEDLLEYDIVKDVNSNYCISLDSEALVQYSERRGSREDEKAHIKLVDKSSLALNLTIVDNRKEAPESYYVNIAGRVFCVPVRTCPTAESGVWIDSNLKQSGIAMMEFQRLDDSIYKENRETIPPVTLFATAIEAKRFGDVDALIKEHTRRQELELTDMKHNLEVIKAESAKAKAELDKQSDSRKEHYEDRSYQRKDDSEKIGVVGKVIAGVVALAGSIVALVRWLG
jgi:hypothetical protein